MCYVSPPSCFVFTQLRRSAPGVLAEPSRSAFCGWNTPRINASSIQLQKGGFSFKQQQGTCAIDEPACKLGPTARFGQQSPEHRSADHPPERAEQQSPGLEGRNCSRGVTPPPSAASSPWPPQEILTPQRAPQHKGVWKALSRFSDKLNIRLMHSFFWKSSRWKWWITVNIFEAVP